jgi:hypothetical protein
MTIKKALYDLRTSVSLMSHTVFERMSIGKLKLTRMTIQLADASVRLHLSIVEDVSVKVGNLFVLGDFVVMKIE